MIIRTRASLIGSIAALLATAAAHAAPIAVSLPGTTQFDAWLDGSLTSAANPGYGSFPGTGNWPTPIGSSALGSGDAVLAKVSNGVGGGPYPAGSGIYYGGFASLTNNPGGTLAVNDATPVAGLKNVVLQIDIGEAWTYDFYNRVLPVLNYNGGSQSLAPTSSRLVEQIYTGTVSTPEGDQDVYRNTWAAQWDLSGISTPISALSLRFTGVQHAQLYALQLDQSDTYAAAAIAAVPEPTTLTAVAAAALGLARLRRTA